ncbi:phage baseplate assembly protein V [Allorhizobium taibaishanense]|uniref:Gp5/Type VI secretion system Vgr protein OB-fold domain-containing protein n=1 Tax=Allorhizobium taibaishanense TaxID=887144 RepID=A0A1Q9A2P9_9HYPH|nr:phage baseplate assembly protein V [Allorhizobium taibaishanense]MBB4005805.1 hypothetical protein [Allorhizobium taibaishanense]OLP48854.1 hypothetical protein BJF91_17110 [Allorhizobium taibaishanense]
MSDEVLVNIILEMKAEVAALRRAVQGMQRVGTVHAVDGDSRRMRMKFAGAEGSEFLSPWRPWSEVAGSEKSWRPPTKGQQMIMLSPFGDMRQGVAVPLTFSDANGAPSSALDARILSSFGAGLIGFTGNGDVTELHGERVNLAGTDGKRVARLGDRVRVASGSSAGLWPIVEASEKVYAE